MRACALAALGARRRPLRARADPRRRGVRARASSSSRAQNLADLDAAAARCTSCSSRIRRRRSGSRSAAPGQPAAHGRARARRTRDLPATGALLAIALGADPRRFMAGEVVAGVLAGSLALLADAGHMLTDAAALGARARRRARSRRGPRAGAGRSASAGRRSSPRRRTGSRCCVVGGRDRLRRRAPADLRRPRCAAGSCSSSRSPASPSTSSRRPLLARAEPREPERARRVPPRRHRPRRVRRHRGRRRAHPRHRLEPRRPDRRASRRRADLLVELGAAARVDADLPRASHRRDRPDEVGARCSPVPHVVEVHDLHVWTVASGFPALSAHVLVDPGADCHAIRRELSDLLDERFGLDHTTLQVDHAPRRAPSRSSSARRTAVRVELRGRARGQDGDRHRRLERHRRGDRARARRRGRARRGRRPARRPARDRGRARARRHRPASCERFVAAAVEQLGGLDILVNNAGLAPRPRPVRRSRTRRTRRPCSRRTSTACPHDAALPAAHPRRRAHRQPRLGRGPAGVRERAPSTSPRSSPCAASPTRCARTCSAARSASRRSTRASSRRTSRIVRFRGDEEQARAVYANVEPLTPEDVADCILFALTRPPHVNVDEIVVKALRPVDRRASSAMPRRPLTILEGSTFCICDELGDIAARPSGFFAEDTRFLSLLRLTINGAAPLLLSSGKVEYFSAAFFLRNPLADGLPQDALSIARERFVGDGMQDHIVVQNQTIEPVAFELGARARRRLRGHLRRQGARLRARRPARARSRCPTPVAPRLRRGATTSSCSTTGNGDVARTQVILSAAAARSTAARCRYRLELEPRERWELRVDVVAVARRRTSRAPRTAERRFGEELDARPRVARRLAAARAAAAGRPGTSSAHAFGRSVADLASLRMRGASGGTRPAARRRHAVVHDRLRPRHAHHVPADAALRARARAQRARGARRAAGDARTTRRSTPSRARSSTRCGTGKARDELVPRATTAPSTRRRSTSSCSRRSGAGRTTRRFVARAARAGAARARAGSTSTATATATASSSTERRTRARAREPVVEGLRRLAALPRRPLRRGADRAVRGAGLRLRREAARWPSSRARSGATASSPSGSSARRTSCARASTRRSGSSERGGYYALALDGEKRAVDSLCSNIGHLLWSGIVPRERVDAVVDAADGRRSSGRAGACGRCRRPTPATTRSRTTTAPSGPTTTP